jgi:redox-sensitive bicupin YhaK (pirin superfamily)
VIGPGDVQWMTAGGGLVHEEKYSKEFSRKGGTAEMVQLWVNLPAKHKLTKPRYQELTAARIPWVELDGGGRARVIAGELAGARGPALTHTPVALWDVRLKEGQTADFDFPEAHSASLLVQRGGVAVNGGQTAGHNELAVFHQNGRRVTLEAKADSTVLLMSGEPIREPIAGYGPFVMNTQEEIAQAMRDYATGKMGHLD